MKKNIFVLMIAIIISKLAAFAKDIVLSYYYGASDISDAYLVSLAIPMVVFGVIGTSMASGYIPMYNEIVKDHGVDRGVKFTNNLINLTLICCSVLVLIVLIFTEKVVLLFASGFNRQTMELAITFTRINIIGIYFIGTFYIFEAFLHQNGNFSASGLTSLPVNFLLIVFIIISFKTDSMVLSIGSVLSFMLHTAILLLLSVRRQYQYQIVLDFKDIYLKRMIFIMLPLIISSSSQQINQIVEKTIASHIAVGGITTLSYAQKLISFLKDVFVLSIVTVLYPNISKMAAEGQMDSFRKTISAAIDCICLLVIPSTIGMMIFSKPIIELLYHRGAFDAQAVSMTSESLFFYSLGLTAFGIRSIFVKALYSLKDVKTPVMSSIISVIANILLNILLSRYLGIGGLALSSSISAILAMILLYISLRKKIGIMVAGKSAATFLKILAVSTGMGLSAKLCFDILKTIFSQNLSLILSVCFGVMLYAAAIALARIETVDTLRDVFIAKIKSMLINPSVKKQFPFSYIIRLHR